MYEQNQSNEKQDPEEKKSPTKKYWNQQVRPNKTYPEKKKRHTGPRSNYTIEFDNHNEMDYETRSNENEPEQTETIERRSDLAKPDKNTPKMKILTRPDKTIPKILNVERTRPPQVPQSKDNQR
ncbi:hypothetical protein C2G38_2220733 [Gigaspora rosea]|uniref:Uncharacterized protein n=1 Tax=Gigaspora rosea TaxID=44941 RepID=A0A397U7G8_9GLOM|nr:hypothetical protein C2G38_2220733 [Gigaspora rosea]